MNRRRFLGQFVWVAGGRILAALLQAVTLVLVARAVSPAEFGFLGAFLGLATIAQTVVDVGISTFIIRERSANPRSGAIAVAMKLNTITSALLATLTAAVLLVLGLTTNGVYLAMIPLAIWIGAERNADARLSVVFADGDVKINVANLLARRTATVSLFFLLHLTGMPAILAYACGSAVAAAGSSAFANYFVRRRVSPASDISFPDLFRQSYPYWVHSMATQARNADVTLVGIFAGATQAGFYSSGSRLTNPLQILPYSLANILLPEATRRHQGNRTFRPLLLLSLAMVAAATGLYAIIFVLMPWFAEWALGPEYIPAIPAIQCILLGLPFAAATALLHALLQGLGKKHLVATTSTVFTVVILTTLSALAAGFGAVGAAVGLSICLAAQSMYLGVRLALELRRRPQGPPSSVTS